LEKKSRRKMKKAICSTYSRFVKKKRRRRRMTKAIVEEKRNDSPENRGNQLR
jgi:hypothetical protein